MTRIFPSREPLPPAIVMGGGANALSIARSLGRGGAAVYALNEPTAHVMRSRHCRPIRLKGPGEPSQLWSDFLLSSRSDPWRGAVLLAACDAGLTLIARHREILAKKFLLDESNPSAQLCMLNKLDTYRAAAAAGVPTPRFWVAQSVRQLTELAPSLVYPLIVKPELSHLFERRFGTKFIEARDFAEVRAAFDALRDAGIDVLLVEKIPGPDDLLCSYYTYLDQQGQALFDFTKRIIRRHPVGMGNACYHVTDRNPALREPALRLFRQVGLRGLANIEFKLDPRDGQLKLIECNARFTAANGLLADCGLDLSQFVYRRIVGLSAPPMDAYRAGVRLWYPIEDFKAFLQMRRLGQLTFAGWVASILRPLRLPFFRFSDPWPSIANEFARARRAVRRAFAGLRPPLVSTQPSASHEGVSTSRASDSSRIRKNSGVTRDSGLTSCEAGYGTMNHPG